MKRALWSFGLDFAPYLSPEHVSPPSPLYATLLRPCRSAEGRTAAAELQENMGSMLGWLDKADGILAIPLQPAEPQHIRDTLGKVQVTSRRNTATELCVGVC